MSKTKKKNKYICENCHKPHNGTYGSGRFCCGKCARSFSSKHVTEDGRKRQIEALTSDENRKKVSDIRKQKSEERKKEKELKKKKEYFDESLYKTQEELSIKVKTKFKNNTKKIGTYGENVIINKCIENDIKVYLPVVDDHGVDMILDIGGKLNRVQVKTSTEQSGVNKDKTLFNLKSSQIRHNNETGEYYSESHGYRDDDVDLFALHDLIHNRSYLIKNDGKRKNFSISYSRTADNPSNSSKLNFSDDFDFDYVIDCLKKGIDPESIVDTTFKDITS